MIPAWFRGGSSTGRVGEKSIAWVDQAESRADGVIKALEKTGKKGKEEVVLDERWMRDKEVALAAGRVLRDAKRVKETARRSRTTLEGM